MSVTVSVRAAVLRSPEMTEMSKVLSEVLLSTERLLALSEM
jgi:hypothetical protein